MINLSYYDNKIKGMVLGMKIRKLKRKVVGIVSLAIVALGGGGYLSQGKTDASIFDVIPILKFNTKVASVNSEDETEFANLSFDADKYPDNIANFKDGKYELNAEDRKLITENGSQKFWAVYSPLDQLGRSGKVEALVTYDSVIGHASSTMKRPDFSSSVHVSGEYKDGVYEASKGTWSGSQSNNEITQLIGYRGYIYNKSHTLAWSLGGDMEVHNVTLGTRAQNVGKNDKKGGMAYAETIVREAIYDNPELKVFYKVTPIYKNSELVPRGSHVTAYSVNDEGKTVNINVWVFNAQNGIKINYQNGLWEKVE